MELASEMREPQRSQTRGFLTAIRWVSTTVLVCGGLVLVRRIPIEGALSGLRGWLESLGPAAPVAFGLIYVAAVVLMLPGSAFTLFGGALFGPVVGTITVSIASNVGAALAFLIARYVARDAVERRARGNAKFAAVDRAVGEGGWRIVALLRLSPAVPFNLQNYLYGLTRIGFWPCVLASWVSMLPGTLLYVYLGHVGRASIEAATGAGRARSPAEWAMIAVGLAATVLVTVYVTRLARRAMTTREGFAESLADGPESEAHRSAGPAPRSPSLVLTLLLSLTAAGVGVAAVASLVRPDLFRSLAALLGAPPSVSLHEAYVNSPGGPRVDHSRLDSLLRTYVSPGGWVDYQGMQSEAPRLDEYLDQIASAPFDELGRDEKLALLINAYNAFTLKLILDHYPIDSIKTIPAPERWDAVRWRVGSHTWSLSQIEHEQIRPKFREPRVHFALVCAAIGCPPLRSEAYSAGRIDEQLEDQARYVHSHGRWFQWDGGATIGLTSLYKWYGGDFEQVAGSVPAFAARYVPELESRLKAGRSPDQRWLPYDWSLNSVKNKPEDRR